MNPYTISFIITALIFLGVSFIVTPKTAKYILAGYNAMDKERQQLYDIKNIVRVLNNTLRIITLLLLVGGVLDIWLDSKIIRMIFLAYLPLTTLLGVNLYTRMKYSTDPIKPFDIIMPIAVLVFIITLTL